MNGLLIFLALAYDAIQRIFDELIFGDKMVASFFSNPWYIKVTHWGGFVILIWSLTVYLMYKWMMTDQDSIGINLKVNKNLKWLIPVAVMASFMMALLEQMMEPNILPQIYREYLSFVKVDESMAIVVSIFQNIYYMLETGLVILLIALMQKAGEKWFKMTRIPWGGSIGLTITWGGIAHLTHGGIATLWICLFAFLSGVFYLISKKSIWASYVFVLLIFVI